jgi:hypothetical protein
MNAPSLSSLSSIVLALGLAACGGDDGVSPTLDAKPIDTPPVTCSISTPNFGAKGALTGNAFIAISMSNPNLYRIFMPSPLETAAPSDLFTFEIYTGYAPFGTQEAPTPAVAGTYQISGNQLQYADCSVCLTMASNVSADGMSYDDDFMATGGTVTITQAGTTVGSNLKFSLSNITFEHVTFDGPTSTPVGDGCNTAITSAEFDGQLMMPPQNKPQAQMPSPRAKDPAARLRGL